MSQQLTSLGETFRIRAIDAEKLLTLALEFIQSKNLYDEYMKFKEDRVNCNE